ncbi:MAG: pYEATS domain-containing protein, partial [Planctomycetota bacterium]
LDQTDRYFGRQGGRRTWEWTVVLGGDPALRAEIAQVTYHLHPTFPSPDRVVHCTPDLRFSHTARGWGTFPLTATVLFRDGTSRQLATHLRFASPCTD